MRIASLFFASVLLLGMVSCKNKKAASTAPASTEQTAKAATSEEKAPTEPEKKEQTRAIVFGNGGGFTGKYQEYLLQEDGQVLMKDFRREEHTPHKKLTRDETAAIFSRMESFNPTTINVSDPGNMSYYLEWRVDDHFHRITWGGGNTNPPADLVAFYDEVLEQLR